MALALVIIFVSAHASHPRDRNWARNWAHLTCQPEGVVRGSVMADAAVGSGGGRCGRPTRRCPIVPSPIPVHARLSSPPS